MLGCNQERLCRGVGDRAAEARRTRASVQTSGPSFVCNLVGTRCRARSRRATESLFRNIRISRDAVPTPSVLTDVSTSEDILFDGSEVDLRVSLRLEGSSDDDDDNPGYNPMQLSPEQLASRRRSGQTASTSASTSTINGDMLLIAQRPAGNRGSGSGSATGVSSTTGRNLAGAAPSFPMFPRPAAAGGPGPPTGPSVSVQVPPEAAQLYAGSSVAGNLSATVGSADVLTPLLDSLQVEPPALSGPGGPASNAQRVYRTSSAEAAGGSAAGGSAAAGGAKEPGSGTALAAAAGAGAAAGPLLVRRKRARTRVLDASELLLARDEAVRTELISRTWNELLRFEERLGGGAATSGRGAAPAAEPRPATTALPRQDRASAASLTVGTAGAVEDREQQQEQVAASLEDVLGFLASTAPEQQDEQTAEQAAQQRAAAKKAQLMSDILRAPTWQRLARLYVKHGRSFSVSHLVMALSRLARFDAAGAVYRGKGRRDSFDRVWEMVAKRVAFAAPRMTGSQVVRVVSALNALPGRTAKRVELTLLTAQRVLRYSSHTMQQRQQQPQEGRPGPGSGTGSTRQRQQPEQGQGGTVIAAPRRRGAGPAAAATTLTRLGRGAAAAGLSEADGEGGPVAMSGVEYAALCYNLGRMNARARPWRMSLRLSPSVARRLLLGSYAQMQPPQASPSPPQQQQRQQQRDPSSLGPQEFAGLLYGLGCMRLNPPAPWMYGFYVSSVRALPAMTDVQLTMLMYGACRVKVKPPPQWIEAYLAALGPRLPHLDGAGLAAAAHGLGRLKYKPRPRWMEAFVAAAHDALARGGLQPGEMSQLARGLMFLGVQPAEDLLEVLWEASGGAMERGRFSPAQLVNLAWALGSLKVPVPRRWYEQLVLQMRRGYHQLRPYHRRRLLAALHAFGCRDLPRWYQVLRIPLVEMPGYAAWSAQQTKQRTLAQHAKAAKPGTVPPQAKPHPAGARKAGAGPQKLAAMPAVSGPLAADLAEQRK